MLICAAVLKTYFLAVLKSGIHFSKLLLKFVFFFSAMAILDLADRDYHSRLITGL